MQQQEMVGFTIILGEGLLRTGPLNTTEQENCYLTPAVGQVKKQNG